MVIQTHALVRKNLKLINIIWWYVNMVKIAETPILKNRLYVKESIRYALKLKDDDGDVLCWFVEDGKVYVAKKETQNKWVKKENSKNV